MNNDLISREALLKAFANSEHIKETDSGLDVMEMLAIKEIIDNAPTIKPEKAKEGELVKAYTKGFDNGVEIARTERPQGECEKCDFRKFTETFVDGVVDVMNKNGITSVEQLQEILKGGAE